MKYPHLPQALHRLLEAGPWEGTAAELYEALEGRQEPWPANPVALALWLKHHAGEHGITLERRHTGERRLLRVARKANGLKGEGITQHSDTFWAFAGWGELEEALPAILQGVHPRDTYTLAYRWQNARHSRVAMAFELAAIIRDRKLWHTPATVLLLRGAVDITAVPWPDNDA